MNKIRVEVVYASKTQQKLIEVELEAGSTILQAIMQSGILAVFPEIDLEKNKVGVYSKSRELTDLVEEGDRVEIYRPLLIDPKEARRVRVKKR